MIDTTANVETPDYAADIARLTGDAVPEKVEKAEVVQEPIATPVVSDIFDPNTLPPSAKAKWEAVQKELEAERRRAQDFEAKYAKIHGQVSPLQRELNRLKSQPAIARTAPPARAEPPVTKETPLQRWQKHKETYGDEAAAIEELIDSVKRDELGRYQSLEQKYAALEQKLAQITEKELPEKFQLLERIQQERERESLTKAQGTVFEAHPDWNEHIRLEPGDDGPVLKYASEALLAWADTQPEHISDMFMSDDPEECKWVMSLFKRDLKEQTTQVDSDQQKTAATQELQKREKNLQSRAVTSASGTGMARVDPSKLSKEDQYALEMQRLAG